jgi:sarcosine/dimethylglycine N-methyltransferase
MNHVQTRSESRPSSTTTGIEAQYSRSDIRERITEALQANGQDLEHLSIDDLGAIDEFHLRGRAATSDLAELAAIQTADHILDLGAGLGGPARWLAQNFGCRVTTVDLSADFCDTAEWLNRATGLADRITVVHADALDLPFAPATFDVVWSQHAQMNVADKRRLYAEARRLLKDGGRLAIWDIIAGPLQPIRFPVPWADTPDISFLAQSDELREILVEARFGIKNWNDLTGETIETLHAQMAGPAGPAALQTFVPNFREKAANLLLNLEEQRLRMLQAILMGE